MEALIALYFWLAFCFIAATLATRYHRNGPLWFFLALVLSPAVAIPALLAAGPELPGASPSPAEPEIHP